MRKYIVAFVIVSLCLSLVGIDVKVRGAEKTGISVTMFDIGQGDSLLIQVNEMVIMVDTGEKSYYDFLKQQLDYYEIERVDMLIISHMDTDHMGAAQLVIREYNVPKVLMPSTPGKSMEYYNLMNYLDKEKIETIYVKTGDKYSLGKKCIINVLGADIGEGTNDSSIVMRLKYYKNTFLFTGDASATVLNRIMEEGQNVKADVLKVPHHGSDSSSPILFLKKTESKYSLISAGRENAYGHPTDNVIRRLTKFDSKILRTDKDGTVTIYGDGKKLYYNYEQIVDWYSEDKSNEQGISGNTIGNKNSKVYHDLDCSSLPMEKNRVYFSSSEEAENAGYRKCGRCGG